MRLSYKFKMNAVFQDFILIMSNLTVKSLKTVFIDRRRKIPLKRGSYYTISRNPVKYLYLSICRKNKFLHILVQNLSLLKKRIRDNVEISFCISIIYKNLMIK